MASRKEYEMLFQLNAQLGSSYDSTFKNAQGTITSMQKEIAALSKTQSDISAYQKQQGAVEASQKKLEVLQQQYDNIQKEMQETGTYSSQLENRLLAKQQQIDKTADSVAAHTAKLERMGNALIDAGINTEDLTGETAKLGNEIDNLKNKQEEAADKANNFGAQASTAFAAAGQALAAAGITVALNELKDAFDDVTEASMVFESAMTGVDKTSDLTSEELALMSAEIKNLSTDIPIVTEELAGIGEVAGQLGIAKDNLMDFSEVMAMLSTATTMTAEEGATMLAQFANITQMKPEYYSNLASAIVDLGNNYATTEQKITDMSQGIAASASLAGMSEADMLGLSAAVTSLGIETQAGSTSMSKLISDIMTAVETGDNLNEFASIANMSAEEFSDAWGQSAVSALQAFVSGLNDTERNGKSATVALTELGITETRMQRMVLSLANSGDLLNNTLATSSKAWTENTALVAEAEKRYATTQSQLIMRENAYNNLKIAIGDNYTPALRELYAVETDVLKNITAFVEQNPELVKAVTAFVGVIGVAAGGLAAYVAIMKVAIPLMNLFTASIPGLNVIMGVAVGVAALTGVIVGLSAATKEETDALTASSRAQHYELQSLNKEYENAKEQYEETSDEVLALRYKVDELTASYEHSKRTLDEFIIENNALIESHDKTINSHHKATAAINDEEQGLLALTHKLQEFGKQTYLTTVEQDQMKVIVDALNEAVPELALNYDETTDSLNMSTIAIEKMVKAQAEQERQAENYQTWLNLTKEETALKEQLAKAEENLLLRRKELTDAEYNVDAPLIGWSTDLDDYIDQVEQLSVSYDENQLAIQKVKDSAEEYAAAQREAVASGENISEVIRSIKEEMAELAEVYQIAYTAAMESVIGQYDLWDEAAKVVETSAWTINNALESQTSYWKDYNTNLAALTERSSEIEGLSGLIATFADGNEESVNAIAGMANATDEELSAMVTNWQNLQKEQETVAESLATLETDFATSMDALQTELESAIEEMNLSDEAAESGRSTVEGFINGSEEMLPAVREAYTKIANAAVAAIDEQLKIKSPSKVFEDRGKYTMSGFVGGVVNMEPEVTAAMINAANNSTDTFALEQNQLIRQFNAMSNPTEAVAASIGQRESEGGTNFVFNNEYNITGVGSINELESILKSRDADLKGYILDVLEDANIDNRRRAFV